MTTHTNTTFHTITDKSFEISIKDYVWGTIIILSISSTILLMPMKIMSDAETKFCTKEYVNNVEKAMTKIDGKVDNVDEKLDQLLLYFGIKGIEGKVRNSTEAKR